MKQKQRAVFLDRDGVLNAAVVRDGKPYPPDCVAAVKILPGVCRALHELKRAGFAAIVVSNQPDVARGTQRREIVEEINSHLAAQLPIDQFATCYHDDGDGCECRKPRPGLLLRAAEERDIDLGASFMVGDRWRDVDAGRRAGCKTVLLDYGYAERGPAAAPDATFTSLAEASQWILQHEVREICR
jgi:D-glycero-D-manno-heptose 1,7-bisphosphate phosphatase